MSERQPSRLRLRFETVGSIAAIVVGVAALFVSWDQGRVMRQELRASLWPALQLDGFSDTSAGGLAVGLRITNAGVGPALIQSITVREDGELVADLDDIEARIGGAPDTSFETATGRILAAGAEMEPFVLRFATPDALTLSDQRVDTRVASGALTDRWSVEVCYCSSLGLCWVADTAPGPPFEVARCDDAPASDL
ncbi:MAG: hypothetical protein RIA71_16250 [Oceanicaulis sp.]